MNPLSISKTKNIVILLFVSSLLSLHFSCKNNLIEKTVAVELPNTPELVCRDWQSSLDKNELDKVHLLSTEKTKAWIIENQAIFLTEEETVQTQFISMNCMETGDKAKCVYTLAEEETGEIIEDYFVLTKQAGQWLVDLEEDTEISSEEQMFKAMQKEIKLQ